MVLFQFAAMINDAVLTGMSSCGYMYSFLLNRFLEVKLPHCIVSHFFFFLFFHFIAWFVGS